MTSAPLWDQTCPVCGAWGNHHCMGPRSATTVNFVPDWNRLIIAVERLVDVLERLVPIAHNGTGVQ